MTSGSLRRPAIRLHPIQLELNRTPVPGIPSKYATRERQPILEKGEASEGISDVCLYGMNPMTISVCFDTDSSLHNEIPSGHKSQRDTTLLRPVYSAQEFQDKIDISATRCTCTLLDPARCRPLLLSDVTLAGLHLEIRLGRCLSLPQARGLMSHTNGNFR